MTHLTDHILSTLNRRPVEADLIVHTIGMARIQGGYVASCPCGWSFESAGRDESSKNAVRTAMHDHKAGVR